MAMDCINWMFKISCCVRLLGEHCRGRKGERRGERRGEGRGGKTDLMLFLS